MVGESVPCPEAGFGFNEKLQDKCGVAVVYMPEGGDVVAPAAAAARALEHRGQGATGIVVLGPDGVEVYKETLRARDAFGPNDEKIAHLPKMARIALIQDRYPTDKRSGDTVAGVQPFGREFSWQSHNGQFTNSELLAERFDVNDLWTCASDSDVFFQAAYNEAVRTGGDLEDGYRRVAPHAEGSFSILAVTEDKEGNSKVIAIRDRHGVRPLVKGVLPNGATMFASEVTALTAAGAQFEREILPGEMVVIDKNGERSEMWAKPEIATCLFEYVYLSKGTNIINGKYVNDVRAEMGRRLARVAPVKADVVIDVPASGEQCALAYAVESGIPYGFGLRKNPKYGRGFIEPDTASRQAMAEGKQEVLGKTVRGKRVVVVEDSQVRGDSLLITNRKLRAAGAVEIHARIAADMYVDTCPLGVATATREELLAVKMGGDLKKMAEAIGADSLAYLPLSEMIEAVDSEELCSGCMGGNYAGREPLFTTDDLFRRARGPGAIALLG